MCADHMVIKQANKSADIKNKLTQLLIKLKNTTPTDILNATQF